MKNKIVGILMGLSLARGVLLGLTNSLGSMTYSKIKLVFIPVIMEYFKSNKSVSKKARSKLSTNKINSFVERMEFFIEQKEYSLEYFFSYWLEAREINAKFVILLKKHFSEERLIKVCNDVHTVAVGFYDLSLVEGLDIKNNNERKNIQSDLKVSLEMLFFSVLSLLFSVDGDSQTIFKISVIKFQKVLNMLNINAIQKDFEEAFSKDEKLSPEQLFDFFEGSIIKNTKRVSVDTTETISEDVASEYQIPGYADLFGHLFNAGRSVAH